MGNLHTLTLLLFRGLAAHAVEARTLDMARGRLSGDGWDIHIRTEGARAVTFSDGDQHHPGIDGIVSDVLRAAGHPVSRANANVILTKIDGEFFVITFYD